MTFYGKSSIQDLHYFWILHQSRIWCLALFNFSNIRCKITEKMPVINKQIILHTEHEIKPPCFNETALQREFYYYNNEPPQLVAHKITTFCEYLKRMTIYFLFIYFWVRIVWNLSHCTSCSVGSDLETSEYICEIALAKYALAWGLLIWKVVQVSEYSCIFYNLSMLNKIKRKSE